MKNKSIPNNYKGKTAEEVWTLWTPKQRTYFLQDHFSSEDGPTSTGKTFDADSAIHKNWANLPEVVKWEVRNHIHEGQYHNGGKVPDRGAELARIYESGTARELWDYWNPDQRTHFILDHSGQFFGLMGEDYKKSADAFIVLTYDTLPKEILRELMLHHATGIYHDGGKAKYKLSFNEGLPDIILEANSKEDADEIYRNMDQNEAKKLGINSSLYEGIDPDNIEQMLPDGGKVSGRGFFGLEKGTKVKSSDDVSVGDILMSHSDQFNSDNIIKITEKRKYGNTTHLSGIYWNPITNKRIGNENFGIDPESILDNYYWPKSESQAETAPNQKLQSRITILKNSLSTANPAAQKKIQKKIDALQAKLDYKPSAKEKVKQNQGKFALDVPNKYSKFIYKKLWSMGILPKVHKLDDTASIVVNTKVNLQKAYDIYSDMLLKEKNQKVPALNKISRKL